MFSITFQISGVRCSCMNGGTCVNSNGLWMCKCPTGFGGDNCQTNCTCYNGGSCSFVQGGFLCSCPFRYTGRQCEHDPCFGEVCPKNASCIVSHGFPRCLCPAGFHSNVDQTLCLDEDECRAPPSRGLCVHGRCSNFHGGYNCTCTKGWTGKTCSDNVNECQNPPCGNGGACHDTPGSYSCSCLHGFSGKNCEYEMNECLSSPCKHNGSCEDHVNYFTCNCESGYTGRICESDTNECLTGICGHHGICTNTVGSYFCAC